MSDSDVALDIAGCKSFTFYLQAFTFLGPISKKIGLKWKSYTALSVLVVCLCFVKNILMYLTHDPVKLNYLGDYCSLYGGPRSQQYVCYSAQLSFSVSHITLPLYTWYLTSTKDGRCLLAKVMEPLRILEGQQACPSYLKVEELKRLRRQTKLIGRIVANSAMYATLSFGPYMSYLFIVQHFRVMGDRPWYYLIANCIFVFVWLHQCMGTVAASFGYFFLMTKMMSMRARNFTTCLISEKWKIGSRKALKLLEDHDDYISTLYAYNIYWSWYMGLMFAEFVPLITTASYMAFLLELNDPIFRIALIVINCELFIMFSAICMAASRVHGCYKHMIGLTNPSLGREINWKITRSASIYERPIGIHCGKLFVVSYETYFMSVAEITSYFLLMVNVVQGGKKSFLYYFLYF